MLGRWCPRSIERRRHTRAPAAAEYIRLGNPPLAVGVVCKPPRSIDSFVDGAAQQPIPPGAVPPPPNDRHVQSSAVAISLPSDVTYTKSSSRPMGSAGTLVGSAVTWANAGKAKTFTAEMTVRGLDLGSGFEGVYDRH